jgi:hypothetical protein
MAVIVDAIVIEDAEIALRCGITGFRGLQQAFVQAVASVS